MDNKDKIDLYLFGKLPLNEAEAFRQELQSNSHLANEVKKRQLIIAGFETLGNQQMKTHLSILRKEMLEEEKPVIKKETPIKMHRWWMAAAAISGLILCTCLFWSNQKSNPTQLFAQHYQPYAASFGTRQTDVSKDLIQAQNAYKKKNYIVAIPLLKQAIQQEPDNSNLSLSLGNAYLAIDKTDLAIQQFQSIIDKKDPLYSDQANWFLALSFLKKQNLNQCKTILQALKDDVNADFHKEAKQLFLQL